MENGVDCVDKPLEGAFGIWDSFPADWVFQNTQGGQFSWGTDSFFFQSSGTTRQNTAKHYIKDFELYEKSFF